MTIDSLAEKSVRVVSYGFLVWRVCLNIKGVSVAEQLRIENIDEKVGVWLEGPIDTKCVQEICSDMKEVAPSILAVDMSAVTFVVS